MLPFQLKQLHSEYRSGFSSVHLLENCVTMTFMGITFPPFSPFYETFNKMIGDLITSGLMDYWHEVFMNPKGLKITEDEIGPQVLTMDHLEICFVICFIPIVLSLLAFFYEIIIFKLKAKLHKSKSTTKM